MDLRDAAAYHALVLNAEGASLATQRNYLFYWRKLIEYCDLHERGVELEAFTGDLIRSASIWYRGQVNPGSSRGGAQAVRQFVQKMNTAGNLMIRESIIPQEQFRVIKAPRVAKLTREPFSQLEIAAMSGMVSRTRSPERDEALLLLLLDTGMRIGEANTLTLDKLDLAEHRVTIGEHGKGRQERVVSIGSADRRDGGRTVRALKKYLAIRPGGRFDHNRVFLSYDGKVITTEALSDAIQHLGDLAGVKHPIPHRLRHTFCTEYLMAYPGDEIGLRRIVGHLSAAVLSDYIHFSQSVIAERLGRVALSERWLGPGRTVLPAVAAEWARAVPAVSPEQRPTGTDPNHSARRRRS